MNRKTEIAIFWFRRDLRMDDNAGLYHALKSGLPVLPVFIFDRAILDKLEDQDDARVTFIHRALHDLNKSLNRYHTSVYVIHDTPEEAWKQLLEKFSIKAVFTNEDYEPYARERDSRICELLAGHKASFRAVKDQVIFSRDEVLKNDGKPYTVFSAYKRKWMEKLRPDFHLKPYPVKKYAAAFFPNDTPIPSLEKLGFRESSLTFPDKEYRDVLPDYKNTRDIPGIDGTSRLSVHLRFGTVSIRKAAADGRELSPDTWLSELVWRDFYAMILWHFPGSATESFREDLRKIRWRNNEEEFRAWCEGRTGYPLVDAGMRQLNETGWMHNRIRMVTASFLSKHLLVDWRWGEAYFGRKLIDYDLASNAGGWQWSAGTGNDAVPYFRVFNPELQQKRFDPEMRYIRKWVPEFDDPFKYARPVVEHKKARERALSTYKKALDKS
jgi:deoxyribodipyrimidine photo-lyase